MGFFATYQRMIAEWKSWYIPCIYYFYIDALLSPMCSYRGNSIIHLFYFNYSYLYIFNELIWAIGWVLHSSKILSMTCIIHTCTGRQFTLSCGIHNLLLRWIEWPFWGFFIKVASPRINFTPTIWCVWILTTGIFHFYKVCSKTTRAL